MSTDIITKSTEKPSSKVVERLIKKYFLIVRKNIQDQVPKAVMNFLVNHIKLNIHSFLVQTLYKQELFDTLLSESGSIAEHRKEYKKQLEACEDAQKTLNSIRDETTTQW